MFRDECVIEVRAGRGGDGLVSFRREKFVPKGGPDGGHGGKGGDVVLVASSEVSSLLGVGRRPLYRARNGAPGGPARRTGAGGEDCVIRVPVGTLVKDAERGHVLRDLDRPGERVVVAVGGRGGRGNSAFATAVRQAPRRAERGRDGEARRLRLELKLFAEVGLVGLPNAGKSTFLAATSAATPKIADYPFTTLEPQVGIVPVDELSTLVVADLPGLIEGAAAGAGLGHRFLRHVERCRVLLFFVDCSVGPARERPAHDLATLRRELELYSPELARRPALVVATKVEDPAAEECADALERATGETVHRISAVQGRGVPELLRAALEVVRRSAAAVPDPPGEG